jgi:hypothetical protein
MMESPTALTAGGGPDGIGGGVGELDPGGAGGDCGRIGGLTVDGVPGARAVDGLDGLTLAMVTGACGARDGLYPRSDNASGVASPGIRG